MCECLHDSWCHEDIVNDWVDMMFTNPEPSRPPSIKKIMSLAGRVPPTSLHPNAEVMSFGRRPARRDGSRTLGCVSASPATLLSWAQLANNQQ